MSSWGKSDLRRSTSVPEQIEHLEAPATAVDLRLEVESLRAGYGKRNVLHDISLTVGRGEIVTVLGHNGAGKTTLLKAIFGMLPIASGRVLCDGTDISKASTAEAVRRGMSLTPAESPIFRELTIAENLELGAFTVSDAREQQRRLGRVHELFPLLKERAGETAGLLSGGQQRMLSIGIALMSGSKLMLLDEPSLGIAPSLVQELFAGIRRLTQDEDLSVLLIEQNVRAALPIADRAYYVRMGAVILEESAEDSRKREHWWDLF
jgi:branched-chain amino acid transport system ATP-binding protein